MASDPLQGCWQTEPTWRVGVRPVGAFDQRFPRSPTDHTRQSSCPSPASFLAWGTPYPEAVILQEGQGGSVRPQAGDCGAHPMTAPALLGGSRGGALSEDCRAAWSPSADQRNLLGIQVPGSIATGQTFLGDHLDAAFSVCFPKESGTARAGSEPSAERTQAGSLGDLTEAEIPASVATNGALAPLRNNYKAGVWVGEGPGPAPLPDYRQNVLELRKSPGRPTLLSGCQGRAASAQLLQGAPKHSGRAPAGGGWGFLFIPGLHPPGSQQST